MTENAAQRYIQANVVPPDPGEVDWKDKPLSFKLYRDCEQIPLGHEAAVETNEAVLHPGSCVDPVPTVPGLSRRQIGQMLVDIYGLTRQCHSIPMFHPMLKYIPHGTTATSPFYTSLLRPVPSGGALFPCELYLLVGLGQTLPVGIYHYDAAHHALDVLGQGDYTALLQGALAHPGETPPAYAILLSSYFWKDGFKYGAFSYRLQGLDIGTVIFQSEMIAHHAGLSTTIHYQFQDKVLNYLLGLDSLHESVYAVIEWRQEENKARSKEAGARLVPTRFVGGEDGQGQATVPTRWGEDGQGQATVPTQFGTINARTLESNDTLSNPSTKSIARWPLPEEIHRASLIETRETFRPLQRLAPIEPSGGGGAKTLALEAYQPLDLWEARTQRRSATGNFLPQPLTRQQLSALLRTSMCGTTNDLDGQSDFLQHTLLYCVVFRVTDIPPGVYRYQPERHALELVRLGAMPYKFHRVLSMPNFYSLFYMSVTLFPVGNYESGFAAYGDRWYRMQNMEAGIIAQRLYLAAAAQNLGCRASLGFPVSAVNNHLGLAGGLSDAKDASKQYQYTSLMQIMVAPESSAYQQYEQSLLI